MEINLQVIVGVSALVTLMIGIGMSLSSGDFSRLYQKPKAVILGSILQLVGIPLVGILVVFLFELTPALALGLIIVSACPGGMGSNFLSYACNGDTALSITLTAISSLVTAFTLPIVIGVALAVLYGNDSPSINITGTSLQVMALTVIPVCTGMLIRHLAPGFARSSVTPFKSVSVALIVVFVIGTLIKDFDALVSSANQIIVPALLLCVGTLAVGLLVARGFRLSGQEIKTLGIEVGVQNAVLAITICITILDNAEAAIAGVVYQPITIIPAAIFLLHTYVFNRNAGKAVSQQS